MKSARVTPVQLSSRIINSDPYGDGWLFEVELFDTEELEGLKDAEGYEESLEE
jgi:glycine cleavage system H protein